MLLFSSCSDVCDCFYGSGPLSTEERSLGKIDGIYLTSNVDLILYEDSVPRMRVTAGKNLIDGIEAKIENGILRVRNKNKCNWIRKMDPTLTLEIWTNNLQSLYVENASGDVTCMDSINTYLFRFDSFNCLGNYRLKLNTTYATLALHNGPADLYVEGRVLTQYNYNAGYGKMNCVNLQSDNVFMRNKGTNDVLVTSTQKLEAEIGYIGNIYYKGNPAEIKSQITGSGKLIKL